MSGTRRTISFAATLTLMLPLKLTLTLTRGIHTTTELACITCAQRRRRHVFPFTSGKRQADLEYARRFPDVYSDVHGVHKVARRVPAQPNIGGAAAPSAKVP